MMESSKIDAWLSALQQSETDRDLELTMAEEERLYEMITSSDDNIDQIVVIRPTVTSNLTIRERVRKIAEDCKRKRDELGDHNYPQ